VLRFLGRSCLDLMVRRSCLVLMVRRMLLVVVVLEIGFDERPFVRLRIGIGVYGVRGIRDASTCQLYHSIHSERGNVPFLRNDLLDAYHYPTRTT